MTSSTYPAELDTDINLGRLTSASTLQAQDHNNPVDAIEAIEPAVGTFPGAWLSGTTPITSVIAQLLENGMGVSMPGIVETFPRLMGGQGGGVLTTGAWYGNTLYVKDSFTMTMIGMSCGGAGSGLTKVRAGLALLNSSGDLTLEIASNDVHASGSNIVGGSSNVAAFATTGVYEFPMSVAGDLSTSKTSYVVPDDSLLCLMLFVAGTTGPSMRGIAVSAELLALPPRLSRSLGGQTDLPSSYSHSSSQGGTTLQYGYIR